VSSRGRTYEAAGVSLAAKTIFLDPLTSYAQNTPVAANDRLRMGMIGVGEQGAGVLRRAIAHPGVECVAACDLWDGRHTLAQEIVGKPIKCTRHYQELLDFLTTVPGVARIQSNFAIKTFIRRSVSVGEGGKA